MKTRTEVVVIGTGFSGIAMAHALRSMGLRDFVVLERAARVGGTWRDNTYPGCACDIPSHLYSFSFRPKPDWSRVYPTQPELLAYLEDCVAAFHLASHIAFSIEVTSVTFDDRTRRWGVICANGREFDARVVVSGMGSLSRAAIPAIPGLGAFEGPAFHSAEWRHDVDLTGRSVAVIGTGASAIQVVPEIASRVRRCAVFQRTPAWVIPKPDRAIQAWKRAMFSHLPFTQKIARARIFAVNELQGLGFRKRLSMMDRVKSMGLAMMRHDIPDEELRAKLTPTYTPGCKRILISNDYYAALARSNVDVIVEPIVRAFANGIETADGKLHPVDAIIFGTGFRVADLLTPVRITGPAGRVLNDDWRSTPDAYKGVTVAGYPNLFLLMGPNTGLGHNSMIYMIESQVRFVIQALKTMHAFGAQTLDTLKTAQRRYCGDLRARFSSTVWSSGCQSWYQNATGEQTLLWPGSCREYRRLTAAIDLRDHVLA